MNLSMSRGDSLTFPLVPSVDCTAAVQLIFTAKMSVNDPDSSAVFQKYLGSGLTIVSPVLINLTTVTGDTGAMTDRAKLVWDIRAFWATGAVLTVCQGTLWVSESVTQGLSTSIPVLTSGAGSTIITSAGPFIAGNSWSFSLTSIYDRNGVAVSSLSGWSAVFTVKTAVGGTIVFQRTSASGQITVGAGPSWQWTVPSSVTTSMAAGTYAFDMTLTDNLGQVTTTHMGTLTVITT